MKRRITSAIVGVTAFVLLALGIPLAIIAQRQILDSEVVELQARAAETLAEIAIPLDPTKLAQVSIEPDQSVPFSVYSTDGKLIFGDGPEVADPAAMQALAGSPASSTDGSIVVATPITDQNETVVGALRLSEPLSGAQGRARQAWLVMGAAGVAALGIAALIGSRIARGLSKPVIELAASAAQLGSGGVIDHHQPVGIAEIDLLGAALVDGSQRVSESLARERRFSADVSHQLRTPLAGMRLKLEAAAADEHSRTLARAALGDLDRIDSTVVHLLAFARDAVPSTSTASLRDSATSAQKRWNPRADANGRSVSVKLRVEGNVAVRASCTAVDQVLDVLIDNALNHGTGAIGLTVREIAGGAAIDVADEGSLNAAASEDDLFRRGHGSNHGIGLSLARSIAEAEGGRLMLVRRHPTTFSLVLLAAE